MTQDKRHKPALVETPPFTPLPEALLVDTSFLGSIGVNSVEREAFIEYVRTHDHDVFFTPYVVEEIRWEAGDAYGVNNWVQALRREDWITELPAVNDGVHLYDGPTAGEMMDTAHRRLALYEQDPADEISKTDSAFAGAMVQLLAAFDFETVGLIIDDANAEKALSDAIEGTYYEDLFRMFIREDVLDLMMDEYESV